MTTLAQLSETQAQKAVTANENFAAVSHAGLFARKASTTAGLTWGYYGGVLYVDGVANVIGDGTVLLTASATNYIQATRAGVVSANTSGFSAGLRPLYTAVTGSATITSYTDYRDGTRFARSRLAKSVAGGVDVTLSAAEARVEELKLTGALTASINVIVPAVAWSWIIDNATSGAFTATVKTAAGAGVAVPQGSRAVLYCDGTDVKAAVTGFADTVSIGTKLIVGGGADTGEALQVTGNAKITGALAANTIALASGTTATLYNTAATTVNAFGAATTIAMGAAGSTLTVSGINASLSGNAIIQMGGTTSNNSPFAVTATSTGSSPSGVSVSTTLSPSGTVQAIGLGVSPLITPAGASLGTMFGAVVNPRWQGTVALTTAYNLFSRLDLTASAAGAIGTVTGLYVSAPSVAGGATTTITNWYGVDVADPSTITPTQAIAYVGRIASGTGRWNLYLSGTANNAVVGNLRLGSTVPAAATLDVTGTVLISSTLGSGTATHTSTSASALAVGANGATNPVLQIDASTASVATGVKIKGAAATAGVAISVISSGANEALAIDARGTGTVTIGGTSTGNVVLGGGGGDIQWNKALVALGGGAAATLGTIGGTGPATAAQNSWMRVLDSAGAPGWSPVWK